MKHPINLAAQVNLAKWSRLSNLDAGPSICRLYAMATPFWGDRFSDKCSTLTILAYAFDQNKILAQLADGSIKSVARERMDWFWLDRPRIQGGGR